MLVGCGLVVLMFLVCRVVMVGVIMCWFLLLKWLFLLVCGLSVVMVSCGVVRLKLCWKLVLMICVCWMISLVESRVGIVVSVICMVSGIVCSWGLVRSIIVFLGVML